MLRAGRAATFTGRLRKPTGHRHLRHLGQPRLQGFAGELPGAAAVPGLQHAAATNGMSKERAKCADDGEAR